MNTDMYTKCQNFCMMKIKIKWLTVVKIRVWKYNEYISFLKRKDDVFLCQLVNTATSSLADDVHHYIIPQGYYWPIDSIFNKLPVFMRQWEKERAVLYPVEVPPP
jgi:hypothetical protein